jgi:hypothetical protein
MGTPLFLQLFVASTIPVIKIIIICGTGAFCARKVRDPGPFGRGW